MPQRAVGVRAQAQAQAQAAYRRRPQTERPPLLYPVGRPEGGVGGGGGGSAVGTEAWLTCVYRVRTVGVLIGVLRVGLLLLDGVGAGGGLGDAGLDVSTLVVGRSSLA